LNDWLTFRAPLDHDATDEGPFFAGRVIFTRIDPAAQGEVEDYTVNKRKSIEGSASSTITATSCMHDGRPHLWISGCPAKWFQGHNVHGSDDVHGLAVEMLLRACAKHGITPSAENLAAWRLGDDLHITTADVTYSWDLGTRPRALEFIRALERTSRTRHPGRGEMKGQTLYYGKHSQRWALKFYSKGTELDAAGRGLPVDLAESDLRAHADGLVRAELRLRSKELQKLGLDRASAWGDTTGQELHAAYLARLETAESFMLDGDVLEQLPGRLRLVHQAWLDGHDLRKTLAARTFYRYRNELLKHGVDIAIKQPRDKASNVIPLRVVLQAKPATVPEWLVGTSWYFEPRARAA
jgi:II/X family phage/plasmid replication protein